MKIRIDNLFVGGLRPLAPRGTATGIFKQAATAPLHLGAEGLEGDEQADRRVHGGPEKALHHFAAASYARLREAFPHRAGDFSPGSMGENLCTGGWTEETVCIGDVFRLGTARVQVCQPRSPCWKINDKFGIGELSRRVADEGIAGWYYRVVEKGTVAPGDEFELVDRYDRAPSLRRLWFAHLDHRPDGQELAQLRDAPGLAAAWVRKLGSRIDWLRENGEG